MFIWIIISLMAVSDLLYWWWADRRLRPLRRARLWRGLLGAFVLGEFLLFAILLVGRVFSTPFNHGPLIAFTFLWHLFALPLAVVIMFGSGVLGIVMGIARLFRRSIHRPAAPADPLPHPVPEAVGAALEPAPHNVPAIIAPTRRQILRAAVAIVPPVACAYALGVSAYESGQFRVRRFVLNFPDLPAALDGVTIANVSDVHIGHFIYGRVLRDISDATNALNPDVVVVTGDLIDHSLDDLPAGIDLLRSFRPRHGLFVCEGNHDLFGGRQPFERALLNAGIPLLLNDATTVTVGAARLQFIGARWGLPTAGRRVHAVDENVSAALAHRRADAFPILLAHHPHAFYSAVAHQVPLTLAGHTHGGQVMLTPNVGPGPMMYDFWSGLYEKPNGSKLVVSNGVGNWFPLRINAPAEIVHLTLRRGA